MPSFLAHRDLRYSLLLPVVIGLAVVALMTQRVLLNTLLVWAHANLWWVLLLALVAGIAGAIGYWADRERELMWPGVVAAVLGLAVFVGALATVPFQRASAYAQGVEIVTEAATLSAYDERAPFVVARARSAGVMDSGGDPADTTFVADGGAFTTPVAGRGPFNGYLQVVSQLTSSPP